MNKLLNGKNTLIMALLICLLGYFSTSMAAIEEKPIPTPAQNAEFLKAGIGLAEEALAHAKQSHGDETSASSKAAVETLKEINSEVWAPKLQSPMSKIRVAGSIAKKGKFEKAIGFLESSIAKLKTIN